ncbi:MAG TPA: DUF3078 domain-containing protein [Myxococcota bacterium]|nr:DUF3078 domain-containing protein [Myxococcota bacterium]
MRYIRRTPALTALAALPAISLLAGPAFAAADPGLLPTEGEVVKDAKPEGWDPALVLGASISLSSNSNFVGQPDGNSFTGGLNLLGALDYRKDIIDWRNTLKINEVFTRTPVIDEFVKTVDQLFFESVIYLRYSETFGPFASVKLETAILEGRDVRPAAIDYSVDGTVVAEDVTSIKTTDAFQPLQLKQAVGVFLRPISKKTVEVDVRAGFGASQTLADGARIVSDVATTTDVIELTSLKDVIQAGAVLGVEAKGEFEDGRVNYSARAEAMMPFINDDPAERSAVDLMNVDIGAKLGFKLFEWASLNYEIKIMRLPQLVDAWQIQNNLLLTFSYALID